MENPLYRLFGRQRVQGQGLFVGLAILIGLTTHARIIAGKGTVMNTVDEEATSPENNEEHSENENVVKLRNEIRRHGFFHVSAEIMIEACKDGDLSPLEHAGYNFRDCWYGMPDSVKKCWEVMGEAGRLAAIVILITWYPEV